MSARDRRPRVAVLHNLPSPYRLPLFRALAREVDLRVMFLAREAPNRTWRPPDELGFDAEWLRPFSARLRGQEYRSVLANPGIVAALRRFRPDAVVMGGYDSVSVFAALGYCTIARVPAVLWSGSTSHERGRRHRAKEAVKRTLVARCAAFIAYGSRAAEYLQTLGADPAGIAIAPNAVDNEYFAEAVAALDRGAERERLGLPAGVPVVLFAGQLVERKDPALLVMALGTLRREGVEGALLVAGDGPELEDLRDYAREQELPVVFTGGLEPSGLPACYAAADLLVLPSREEIWGLVANEAMASGRPVVISDACGAAADLVEPGVSGALFPAGDAAALTACLRDLLAGPDHLREMGEAARERVGLFSIERESEGFLRGVRLALGEAP